MSDDTARPGPTYVIIDKLHFRSADELLGLDAGLAASSAITSAPIDRRPLDRWPPIRGPPRPSLER